MTHTLHRTKDPLKDDNDFVILAMPARGINNDQEATEKLKDFLRIFRKHNSVNMGGIGIGHQYDSKPEQIIEQVYNDLPMVHGVFNCRQDLIAALREIKEVDLGISLIISGLVDEVNDCLVEAGLKRHSINYSLGIWGDRSRLPEQGILEITTMCGHAMVSPNLVRKMILDIRKGRKSIAKAAAELARPCVCGIFNAKKAAEILEKLV